MDVHAFAQSVDHTLLKADANVSQIQTLCQEALQYNFFSVCVNPHFVSACQNFLKNSSVQICTVVGFPLGATTLESKAFETKQAIKLGAHEIDMVLSVGAIKSEDWDFVFQDIKSVVQAAEGRLVKVILETCYLTQAEKIKACELSVSAGAHFVKTSTGFGSSGASVPDILLMRKTVGPNFGVKASGGIRDVQTAKSMLAAGANRLGLSSSVAIFKDWNV